VGFFLFFFPRPPRLFPRASALSQDTKGEM
jgi:hypothetical protein